MRYNVGSKSLFMRINYTASSPRFAALYLPWEDKLHSIKLLPLLCTEHHKVNWRYDDTGQEPKHDGFVFKEESGRVWHNQYPIADYGQMCDRNDRLVMPSDDREEDDADHGSPLFGYFEDVSVVLGRIERGLRLDGTDALPKAHAEALKNHYNEIVALVEAMGWQVENKPHVIHFTDNRPPETVESIRDIVVTERSTSPAA